MQCIEDKFDRATPREGAQSGDDADKENNMADTANCLKVIDYPPECKIEQHRNNDKSNKKKSSMPSFRLVGWVVEDD